MSEGRENAESIYFDGAYLQRNPTWHSEDSVWKARHVARLLADNSIRPTSVVDVGCGAGQVLAELRQLWPDATLVGWEVSPDVAQSWDQPRGGIDLRQGDFRADDQHYEVALMLDVFEHVPDYMGLLRDARELADKLVFHIPLELNISSVARKRYLHSREAIGHIHYFSAESALAVLRDTGYHVVDSRFTRGARDLRSAQRTVTHFTNLARSAIELLGVRHASTILGGYSLLVLATAAKNIHGGPASPVLPLSRN